MSVSDILQLLSLLEIFERMCSNGNMEMPASMCHVPVVRFSHFACFPFHAVRVFDGDLFCNVAFPFFHDILLFLSYCHV